MLRPPVGSDSGNHMCGAGFPFFYRKFWTLPDEHADDGNHPAIGMSEFRYMFRIDGGFSFALVWIDDGDFAAMPRSHQCVSLVHVLQFEAVGDELVGMDAPANQVLHQLLHAPQRGDP